jgi:hypothetical protein
MTLTRKVPLRSKTPLRSSGWKASPAKQPDWRSELRSKPRATLKSRPRPKHTKAEQAHLDAVVRLGCIACRNAGLGETPCEIHHVRFLAGAGQRSSHFDVLGLCPPHHRTGGHGVAIHDGRETWESIHGTEADLLAQTREETGLKEAA